MLLSLKRALRVTATIAGWIIFDFSLLYFISFAEDQNSDAFVNILGIGFLVANLFLIPAVLIYLRHRRRKQWIKDEAERWLTIRVIERTGPSKRWPRRLRRGLLLVPSALAVTVLFFESESFGVLSQLFHGRTAIFKGHRLHIPATAFISDSDDRNLSLLLGKGIARVGLSVYLGAGLRLTSVNLYVDPPDYFDRSFIDQNHPADREFAFGQETLDCRFTDQRPPLLDRDMYTYVSCVTSNRDFVAYFGGPTSDLPIFYEILTSANK
jgi:hypothetical protein